LVRSRVHRADGPTTRRLTGTKTNTETIGRRTLAGLGYLRVEPDRESRIGVAKPFLCGLDVDPLLHERCRIRATEIVELQAGASDDERRWDPDTVVPVAVVEAFPIATHEEKLLGVKRADTAGDDVIARATQQRCRRGNVTTAGFRLRSTRHQDTVTPASPLLEHREVLRAEVDIATDSELIDAFDNGVRQMDDDGRGRLVAEMMVMVGQAASRSWTKTGRKIKVE
jgi:hypothetical protein